MKAIKRNFLLGSAAAVLFAPAVWAENYVISAVDAEMPEVVGDDGLTIDLPGATDVYTVTGNRSDTWWGTVDVFNGRLVCTNSAALSMCTVINRNSDQPNTLEIAQIEDDNYGALRIRGPLNVVKSGPAVLKIINRDVTIEGTLDVAEGTLCLAGPMLTIAGNVIVRSGATLDLGGFVRHCDSFVLDGGTICNGTLIADSTDIRSGEVEAALSGAEIRKTGESEVLLTANPKSTSPTLLNGLVCCYHFDSDETLCEDASSNGYVLENCYTNDAMKVEPTSVVRCDKNIHAYGEGGSAYFDGKVFLHLRDSVWPDKASSGSDNPYSYAFWVRVNAENLNGRGIYFFGTANNEGANAMIFQNADSIWSYFWSSSEWDYYLDRGAGRVNLTEDWHSVVQTWDGSVYRCYIDGIEAQYAFRGSEGRTKAWGGNLGNVVFNIGAGHNAWPLIGWLDEFAVWNRALTPAEIAAYNDSGVPTEIGQDAEPLLSVEAGTLKVIGGASASLKNGIVMSYHFDSEEGLLSDSSANGTTLVKETADGRVEFSPVEKVSGDGAIYFDGSTTLTVADGWPTGMPSGNAAFSCAFFFRCDDSKFNYADFGLLSWGSTDGGDSCNANVLWDWQSRICNYSWGDQDCLLVPGGERVEKRFSSGWHSYVQTWDGELMRFYVDGVEQTPVNNVGEGGRRTANTSLNVGIGLFRIAGGFNNAAFIGWMDEVTVWNRALTSTEAVSYCGGGLSGMALDGCTVEVNGDAALTSVVGSVEIAGGIVTGGLVDGDLVLRDGARVVGVPGKTTSVSGALTVEGTGSVSARDPMTSFPAVFPMFEAEDGVTAGSAAMARTWRFDELPRNTYAKFTVGAGMFRCSVNKKMTVIAIR